MLEYVGQGNGQAGQQGRGQGVGWGQEATGNIVAVAEFQKQGRIVARVEDPVLGNTGAGIYLTLANKVAVAVG